MKKKIVFVINTLGRAGAEMAMTALMNKLDESQYEISLYVMLAQGELIKDIPPYVHVINKNFCDKSVLSSQGKKNLNRLILKKIFAHGSIFKNIFYVISVLFSMIKKHRIQPDKLLWRVISDGSDVTGEEFDLAVAYIEGASAYYVHDHVKAKKKAGFIHIDYSKAGYTRKTDKNCYDDFDRIFTVSDEVKECFISVYPELEEKTKVFHNIIDEEKIISKSSEKMKYKMSDKGIRLLTVGRLTYQKGYDVAVYALKELINHGFDVNWYILGDGPEYQSLAALAVKEGIDSRFHLLGAVDNPYPYYKAADIYVHATRFEGKSIAIQEAQVLGCAIIASDCSGNREQINDGVDGILCGFTPAGIADGIEKLITNPALATKFRMASAEKQINHLEELQNIYGMMR